MSIRRQLTIALQSYLDHGVAPALVAPDEAISPCSARHETILLAALTIAHLQQPAVALAHLQKAIELPTAPDPLFEPLLRCGEIMARGQGDERLANRFADALAVYRQRYAVGHALMQMGEAMTEWALAAAAPLRPLSAVESDEEEDSRQITLMRLRDASSARFQRAPARLYDISEEGLGFREIVLEVLDDQVQILESLAPGELSLRMVYSERFTEASASDGSLFDVEINVAERRIYSKLRQTGWDWRSVESIVVMAAGRG